MDESVFAAFAPEQGLSAEQADLMVENVVGVLGVPLGICANLRVDDADRVVPMATEEPSVVAAASHAANLMRASRGILTEVAALSPRITLNVHSMASDPGAAARFGVSRTPAVAIIGAADYGVRFYGMPAGYEFATLLELILDVSKAQPPLSEATKSTLGQLKEEAHIQVFVTPT